jgi:RNA polymerase sigma factor (sigma-70 family)
MLLAVDIGIAEGELPDPGTKRGAFGESLRKHSQEIHDKYGDQHTTRIVDLLDAADALFWAIALRHQVLVVKACSSWSDREDKIQEANLGLFRAALRWDPRIGAYQTYARQWVKSYLLRHALQETSAFTAPERAVQNALRLSKEVYRAQAAGLDVTAEEVRVRLNVNASVARLLDLRHPILLGPRDVGQPQGDGPGIDHLPDEASHLDIEGAAIQQERKIAITAALSDLPDRHRVALMMHFGMAPYEKRSFEAIGRHLNLSGSRTRQLVNESKHALREHPLLRRLDD